MSSSPQVCHREALPLPDKIHEHGQTCSPFPDNQPRKRTVSCLSNHDVDTASGSRARRSGDAPLQRSGSASYQRQSRGEISRLLKLPTELRELIWIHAVTEWQQPVREHPSSNQSRDVSILYKRPIRLDRLNRPAPPAITDVSQQVRNETLPLYYGNNIFECWRPLLFREGSDLLWSTFGDWLQSIGPEQAKWLRHVVLLYKHENELDHDICWALQEAGLELQQGVVSERRELSEYELSYESMGLPRHFGKRQVWDRWTAGSTS